MRILHSLITISILSFSTLASVGCATTGEDDYGEAEDEAASTGKLTFWQSPGGEWRFNVKSGNGAILLTSEGYAARAGAIGGALSVLGNGVDKAMYRVNKTATGYNVHLHAANGESIGFTEVYSTKSNATRAVGSTVRAITSYLDKREANTTGARVEVLFSETSGQYRFNVHARNGQIVLSSEQYTTEANAYNGAFAVQAAGQSAASYTIKENAAGGFYFTLTASNGQIVGVSQQYTTRQSAAAAITSLQSFLPDVTVL